MSGTSQATAVVSGLAALTIEYARFIGLDLGPAPGASVMAMLTKSAMRLSAGGTIDFGHGFLLWPNIRALVEDCAQDSAKRDAVFQGPALRLLL